MGNLEQNLTINSKINSSWTSILESETYAITKVCFSVCILTTTFHVILITTNRQLRRLYGLCLCITLYLMVISYIGALLACSFSFSRNIELAINIITNSSIMGINTSLFAGILIDSYFLHIGQYSLPQRRKNKLFYLFYQIIISCIFPILFMGFYIIFTFQSMSKLLLSNQTWILPKKEILCGIGSTHVMNIILFSTIIVVLAIQLILAILNGRKFFYLTGECMLISNLRDMKSRHLMHIKLVFTNLLIWTIAFFAIEFHNASMWHIFTLSGSLQSIFLTISFIFSRPVLDILHSGDQTKGISRLALNKGILYSAVPRLTLKNNILNKSIT